MNFCSSFRVADHTKTSVRLSVAGSISKGTVVSSVTVVQSLWWQDHVTIVLADANSWQLSYGKF